MHVFLTGKTNCALRLVEEGKKEKERERASEAQGEGQWDAKYRETGERETDRGREQTWTKRENERLQRESLALKPRLKQRVPPAN